MKRLLREEIWARVIVIWPYLVSVLRAVVTLVGDTERQEKQQYAYLIPRLGS